MGGNPESREGLAFQAWLQTLPGFTLDGIDLAKDAWNAGIAWHRKLIKHDDRARQLSQKTTTKAQLVGIAHDNDRKETTWPLNSYERWTRDELINRILDQEYPEVRPRPGL